MKSIHPRLIALLAALFAAAPAAAQAQQPPAAKAESLPAARVEGLSFSVDGDALVLKDESSGKISRLHVVAAAVFALSDGKTSPSAIRDKLAGLTGYTGTDELVFAALDALADAKLLQARVSPPGTSPLELVVAPDGTLGSALVAAASAEATKAEAKGASKEEARKKNITKESAVKDSNRAFYKDEQQAKAADSEIVEKAKVRKEALVKRGEADSKHQIALREDPKLKGENERKEMSQKTLHSTHLKAQTAASDEATPRLKLEQARKHSEASKKK